MTLTSALTPYTCAVACLESYFADIQKPLDQCEILRIPAFLTNPDPSKFNEYGAMSDYQVVGLSTHLGYRASLYQDFRQQEVQTAFSDSLTKNSGVLISCFWRKKVNHCVRLSKVVSSGIYKVMNPTFGNPQFEQVKFDELVDWGFRIMFITS